LNTQLSFVPYTATVIPRGESDFFFSPEPSSAPPGPCASEGKTESSVSPRSREAALPPFSSRRQLRYQTSVFQAVSPSFAYFQVKTPFPKSLGAQSLFASPPFPFLLAWESPPLTLPPCTWLSSFPLIRRELVPLLRSEAELLCRCAGQGKSQLSSLRN